MLTSYEINLNTTNLGSAITESRIQVCVTANRRSARRSKILRVLGPVSVTLVAGTEKMPALQQTLPRHNGRGQKVKQTLLLTISSVRPAVTAQL
jgi:hypothetical protein